MGGWCGSKTLSLERRLFCHYITGRLCSRDEEQKIQPLYSNPSRYSAYLLLSPIVRVDLFVSLQEMQLQGRVETILSSLPIRIMLEVTGIGLTQAG